MLIDFLNLPTVLLCSITMIVSAGVSILALFFIRKRISWEFFRDSHEVGGFLFNALGLIYAVLIAFVVFATWTEYKEAANWVDLEAVTVHDLYLDSEGLDENVRLRLQEKLLDYANVVINEDWPLLSLGIGNDNSREKLHQMWKVLMSVDTIRSSYGEYAFQELVRKFNELSDYRRLRIMSSANHIPGVIWAVIIIGALTSVGFSLFFGTKNLKVQAIMTALFAMTNAIILLLILILDHPFTGDIKIKPDNYIEVRDKIQDSINQ